jgi:hypothetical protein
MHNRKEDKSNSNFNNDSRDASKNMDAIEDTWMYAPAEREYV